MKINNLILILILGSYSFSFEKDMDLKVLFSNHYKEIFYLQNDLIDFKTRELIKRIKENVYCEKVEKDDEMKTIKVEDLKAEEFYWSIEKIFKDEKGRIRFSFSKVPLHQRYIRIKSEEIPDKSFTESLYLKKKTFHNCKDENMEKLDLIKYGCTTFEIEYFIYYKKEEGFDISNMFCFNVFSFYDEQDKNTDIMSKRKIRIYGILNEK